MSRRVLTCPRPTSLAGHLQERTPIKARSHPPDAVTTTSPHVWRTAEQRVHLAVVTLRVPASNSISWAASGVRWSYGQVSGHVSVLAWHSSRGQRTSVEYGHGVVSWPGGGRSSGSRVGLLGVVVWKVVAYGWAMCPMSIAPLRRPNSRACSTSIRTRPQYIASNTPMDWLCG